MKRIIALLILGTVFLTAFTIPEKLEKKVDKEIVSLFETEVFTKEIVAIPNGIVDFESESFKKGELLKVISNTKLLGYAYIGNAPSKTATYDYLVLFDADLVVVKTKVLVYREEYGGEIGSKRWLKQFIGKSQDDQLEFLRDIAGISGATISARSMTNAVNDVLKGMNSLHEKNIL